MTDKTQDNTKAAAAAAGLMELEPIARDIAGRVKAIAKAEGKADEHRLAAALRLAEAEKIAAATGIDLKRWVQELTPLAWETARKLLAVGKADNPQEALAAMRKGDAERQQESRKRKASGIRGRSRSRTAATGEGEDAGEGSGQRVGPFTEACELLETMPKRTAEEVIRACAPKLDLAVMSKAEADKAKAAATPAGDAPAAMAAYKALMPAARHEFCLYVMRDCNIKAAGKPELKPGDEGNVPDFMKRTGETPAAQPSA